MTPSYAADLGGPALLLLPGPAAFSKDFDCNQPLIAGRRAPADQAGQGLLPRQAPRVPGPRAGSSGVGCERRDWLPVNELGGAMDRPTLRRSRWRSGSGSMLVLETTLKALCGANMCMCSLWFVHGHDDAGAFVAQTGAIHVV